MARILVMSFSDFAEDPRVDRQVGYLRSAGHHIITAGHGPSHYPDVDHIELDHLPPSRFWVAIWAQGWSQLLRFARRWDRVYWSNRTLCHWRRLLDNARPDAVIVNDAIGLPLAFEVAHDAPVIFDAHEYASSEYE